MRVRLTLHYDGARYSGWQLQPERRTVQGELEKALSRLLGGAECRVAGAGRTDAGVHATGQVAAADVPGRWEAEELRSALNATVDRGIWVASAERAPPGFHPRFDAVRRTYLYRVGTEPDAASPHEAPRCWPLCRPLDRELLERGGELLLGTRSFEAFARAGQPERGHECTVLRAEWESWRLGFTFTISANRFLHRMVRYLVGTLAEAGLGRRPLAEIEALLRGESGLVTSPPAPASGLFLARVDYE